MCRRRALRRLDHVQKCARARREDREWMPDTKGASCAPEIDAPLRLLKATHSLTRAYAMPLPRSSEVDCLCHSLMSRQATIAPAARNKSERPVLLASFSRRLLIARSARTEN